MSLRASKAKISGCCPRGCGRSRGLTSKTCCETCVGPEGPHTAACFNKRLQVVPLCVRKCGRPVNGSRSLCCEWCDGTGSHSPECAQGLILQASSGPPPKTAQAQPQSPRKPSASPRGEPPQSPRTRACASLPSSEALLSTGSAAAVPVTFVREVKGSPPGTILLNVPADADADGGDLDPDAPLRGLAALVRTLPPGSPLVEERQASASDPVPPSDDQLVASDKDRRSSLTEAVPLPGAEAFSVETLPPPATDPDGRAELAPAAAAGATTMAPPPSEIWPQRRRRALLIGANYVGTRAQMRRAFNDVQQMETMLTRTMGWEPSMVRRLTDEDPRTDEPTKATIRSQLRWLASGDEGSAEPGDHLFLYVACHGAQEQELQVQADKCEAEAPPSTGRTAHKKVSNGKAMLGGKAEAVADDADSDLDMWDMDWAAVEAPLMRSTRMVQMNSTVPLEAEADDSAVCELPVSKQSSLVPDIPTFVMASMRSIEAEEEDADLDMNRAPSDSEMTELSSRSEPARREALVPLDFAQSGLITQDDIFETLVKDLPEGVKLTAVFDCRLRGALLGLPFEFTPAGMLPSQCKTRFACDLQVLTSVDRPNAPYDMEARYGADSGGLTAAVAETMRETPGLSVADFMTSVSVKMVSLDPSLMAHLATTQKVDINSQFLTDQVLPNTSDQFAGVGAHRTSAGAAATRMDDPLQAMLRDNSLPRGSAMARKGSMAQARV